MASPTTAPTRIDRCRSSVRHTGSFLFHGAGRAALPGLVGSCLITAGSVGAGAVRRHDPLLEAANLSWLRYGHGQILSGALLWIGVLLMIAAWVKLGRSVIGGRVELRDLRWVIPLWTAPMLISVPLFSRDAYSYLAQGALLRDGFNPYQVGPVVDPGPLLDNVSTIWSTTTAPYGPAFMLVARAVTTVTGDNVVTGTIMLRLTMLPGLALAVWAIPRLARHLGGSPAVALWLAVLNPLVLIHLIGGVHNEMLMVGLLTAGIVLALEGRHVAGIGVLAVAVAVKVTAGAALPFIVWIWMRHVRDHAREVGAPPPSAPALFVKTAGIGVAVFAAVFAAASAIAGVSLGWMTALSGSAKIINWLTLPTAVAQLFTVATSWFTHWQLAPVLEITRLLGLIALCALSIAVWIRYRRTVREAMLGTLFVLIAIVVLSPAALPWYYSWPLSIAAGFALSPRTLAVLVGLSSWLMLIFQPDGSIGMYQWSHVLLATAASVVAGLSLTRVDPLRIRSLLGLANGHGEHAEEAGDSAAQQATATSRAPASAAARSADE